MDADIAGPAHQLVHDRTVQDFKPARTRGFADNDLCDVVGVSIGHHVIGNGPFCARNGYGFPAERLCQTQGIGDAIALLFGQLEAAATST